MVFFFHHNQLFIIKDKMKHILNNLSEEEKNAIREQHTGGMKVMNENFSKLLNSKLGDVKPLVNEQQVDRVINASVMGGPIVAAIAIANGSGTSDQKVKSLCELCKKSKAQVTPMGNRMADAIRDSVQGMGTNEKNINNVFRSLRSFDDFCSLVRAYQSSYSVDLYSDLDADIDSESEWVTIFRPIRDLLLKSKQQGTRPTPQTVSQPAKPVVPKPSNFVDPKLKRQQLMPGGIKPQTKRQAAPQPAQGTRPQTTRPTSPQPSQVRPSTTRPVVSQQRPNYPI
jgi:hypothetical protein